MHGQEQYGLPSRFIAEMPKELIEFAGGVTQRFGRYQAEDEISVSYDEFDQRPAEESLAAKAGLQFEIGSKVRHADFGEGQVMAAEKTSLGEKVTVRFHNGSLKKLIAEYAHLERA